MLRSVDLSASHESKQFQELLLERTKALAAQTEAIKSSSATSEGKLRSREGGWAVQFQFPIFPNPFLHAAFDRCVVWRLHHTRGACAAFSISPMMFMSHLCVRTDT